MAAAHPHAMNVSSDSDAEEGQVYQQDDSKVWAMIIIYKHAMCQHVEVNEEEIKIKGVPDGAWGLLPKGQVERIKKANGCPEYLFLGNGYPSYKFQFCMAKGDTQIFTGLGARSDNLVIQRVTKRTMVFEVQAVLLPRNSILLNGIKPSGEAALPTGYLHDGADKLYPNQLIGEFKAKLEEEQVVGPWVSMVLIDKLGNLVTMNQPLYNPGPRLVKRMRLNGKQSLGVSQLKQQFSCRQQLNQEA